MAEFSKKTIAERVRDAYHTGEEAKFADSDTSTVYEFTPEGLRDWMGISNGQDIADLQEDVAELQQNVTDLQNTTNTLDLNLTADIDNLANNYYDKTEINSLIDGIAAGELVNYYDKDEIDTIVDGLETDIQTVSDDLDDNYYTKTETENLSNLVNYYTESQVDDLISDEIRDYSDFIRPEDYGAVGDGVTNDTSAFIDTFDAAYLAGKKVLLSSSLGYIINGPFIISDSITVVGSSRDVTVQVNNDNTKEGFLIKAQGVIFSNFTIKANSASSITNGTGHLGTCVTLSEAFVDPSLPEPIEVRNILFHNMDFTRTSLGTGHAVVCMSRTKGVLFQECRFVGAGSSATTGAHSSAMVSHWGAHTHGASTHALNYDNESQTFVAGRVLTGGTSGATAKIVKIIDNGSSGILYLKEVNGTFQNNETITGASTGGSALADGVLYSALVYARFEPERYSFHPNNITLRNCYVANTGRVVSNTGSYAVNVDGLEYIGNNQGGQLFDLPCGDEGFTFAHPESVGKGYSSFSYRNIVARNVTGSGSLGITVIDWSGQSVSKQTDEDLAFYADSSYNTSLYGGSAKPRQRQWEWKNILFENITFTAGPTYPPSLTRYIWTIYLRNLVASATFINVRAEGTTGVLSTSLANVRGKISFDNCDLLGGANLDQVNGITFTNCRIEKDIKPIRDVSLASYVLAFDAQTTNFTVGQTVTGQSSGCTGVISSQSDGGTTGTLTLTGLTAGSSETIFRDNELITDPLGGSATSNIPNRFYVGQTLTGGTSGASGQIIRTLTPGRFYIQMNGVTDYTNSETLTGTQGDTQTCGTSTRTILETPVVTVTGAQYTAVIASINAITEGNTTIELCTAVPYDGQSVNFTLGNTLTTATGSGVLVAQTDNGASGIVYLKTVTGTFTDNQAITSSGTGNGNVNGSSTAGFSYNVLEGDTLVYNYNGTTKHGDIAYSTQYHDLSNSYLSVDRLTVATVAGDTIYLRHYSDNIYFINCEIRGGTVGIQVDNSYVNIVGGIIRDAARYGLYNQTGGKTKVQGTVFSNNGLTRLTVTDGASFATRHVRVLSSSVVNLKECIFRDSKYCQYAVVVPVGANGGSMRDCVFEDTPATGYVNVVNPQTAGGYFSMSGNTNADGLPIANVNNNQMNAVVLTDGATAPSTVAGYALIYVDTADGDLKIKFGDGTTKTIATDT